MDLLRKALREVEARVKPFTAASTSRSDEHLAGALIVAGRTFRVGAMFAEGGAARVPLRRRLGRTGEARRRSRRARRRAGIRFVCQLWPSRRARAETVFASPELSDEEARREGIVHASVSARRRRDPPHHDVLVRPSLRRKKKAGAAGSRRCRDGPVRESLAERARRRPRRGGRAAACACAARAVAHMHARDPPVAHLTSSRERAVLAARRKKKRRRGVRAVDVASVRLRERPRRRRPRVFDAAGPFPRGVAVRANHHAHLPRAGDVGRAPSNLRGARGWAPGGRLGARVSAVPASGGPAPLRRGR